MGAKVVAPLKSNCKVKYHEITYKDGNIIERLFCQLKNYRRIATGYEKTAKNFLAMLHVAAICLWIK